MIGLLLRQAGLPTIGKPQLSIVPGDESMAVRRASSSLTPRGDLLSELFHRLKRLDEALCFTVKPHQSCFLDREHKASSRKSIYPRICINPSGDLIYD